MVLDRVWTEVLPRRIADWQLQSPEPPADFYERFARLCRECPSSDMQEWLAKELAAPSGWLDTHPSLSERLASLKEPPHLGAADNCAGEQLLGESWPKILAEFNARWARKARPGWLLEHLRRNTSLIPCCRRTPRPCILAAEKRLARARTLRSTDPAAGLLALRELHAESPGHRHIRFSYGAALLAEDEEAGVELMEALAREHPAFRVQAFLHVVAYFERIGMTGQDRTLVRPG